MSAEAEVKLRTLQFEYRMMERERLKTKALLGEALWALRRICDSIPRVERGTYYEDACAVLAKAGK